jgi:hypothetical protein
MSDSQEKSDDLIAELAKLMASNAQGTEGAPKPTVIKLPPLDEATIKTTPVRIPGMESAGSAGGETPKPDAAATAAPKIAPVVRIPGLEKPAGVAESKLAGADPAPAAAKTGPAVTEPKPAAAESQPASKVDFGRLPGAAPAIPTEPLVNWKAHGTSKSAAPDQHSHGASPAGGEDKPGTPLGGAPRQAPAASGPGSVPPAPGAPTASRPAPSGQPDTPPAGAEGIGFDFGFGGSGGNAADTPAPSGDPIADLIAAELDAGNAAPGRPAEHAPAPPPVPSQASSAPSSAALSARPEPGLGGEKPASSPSLAASAIPVKPVGGAPRPADGDRFTVAPVFGLSGKPASAAPVTPPESPRSSISATQASAPAPASHPEGRPQHSDPMDEIESLIGEAVRGELGGQEKRPAPVTAPEPAPVVPPLSSNFAPRRAGIRGDGNVESAEAAILAAAAASGAEVGRVDAPVGEERPYKRMKVKPPRTSLISSGARQYVGIAVAGTLLLAAGFGLYWVLGMNRDDPATAPVLTADAEPAKVEPVATATTAETSGSVVFNEINGGAPGGSDETLVSRDETAGASPVEVARAVTPTDEVAENGLANRKVRTVTVRPDGTIVSGDEAVAGIEALPVDRPNVPEIPGAEMAPSDLLTAAVADTQSVASRSPPSSAVEGSDAIAALVAGTGESNAALAGEEAPLEVAALDATNAVAPVFDGGLTAPIPMPRPASRSGLVGGAPLMSGSTGGANAPASTPLVAVQQPSASSSGGGAYVQLSSQRTEDEARRSLSTTQQRMSGMLNGASLEIRRVDLGAKGVWYRVVLPVDSFQSATQTCAAIKANGGDCVPING